MKILIKNVKTSKYLAGQEGEELLPVWVLVQDDIIQKVSFTPLSDPVDQEIDGKGSFLSPGLCDPQVHFREPGLEYKEDIKSGSLAAVKGGFTSVISMPNTAPTADTFEVVSFMASKSKEHGICRVYPTGAVTIGLKGEEIAPFEQLKKAGAIALTDDGKGVQRDDVFLEAMKRAAKLDLPILDHSEDESLSLGGAIHKGKISEKYGIKGIDAASEATHVERGCRYSAETNCHYHVLHISTKKSIEYVRKAKKQGLRVTAEVSPHHLLLCDELIPERSDGSLDSNWKMNPPLRSKEDRDACVEALLDGTIDAIATDHAPHAPHEKDKMIADAPFGIIGLETAFPLIYTNFVRTGKLKLSRVIDLMSKQAGALFKLDIGRIEAGKKADLVLLNLEKEVTIDDSFFMSKSKNSPFVGNQVYGEALLTMMNGKIVYSK